MRLTLREALASDGRECKNSRTPVSSVQSSGSPWLRLFRIARHRTYWPAIAVGAASDVVRDEGSSFAHGFWSADRGILRSLEFKLGIYLGSEEHDIK